MKYTPEKWKVWMSYLFPITLEQCESDINEELQVQLYQGMIQLCTKRAVYSYEKKYDNFGHLINRLALQDLSGNDVLILGLGLGSIIQLLEDIRNDLIYTAIEIDEEVIYLIEKYIMHKVKSPVNIICADAEVFLENTDDTYNLICMDVFVDDAIPDKFLTHSFVELLKNRLAPSGILIFNCPAFNKNSKKSSLNFYDEVFHTLFSSAVNLNIHKNFMLLNDNHLLRH